MNRTVFSLKAVSFGIMFIGLWLFVLEGWNAVDVVQSFGKFTGFTKRERRATNIVYVEYFEVAPWNLWDYSNTPRIGAGDPSVLNAYETINQASSLYRIL